MEETQEQMLERSRKALDRVEIERADYKGDCKDCAFKQRGLDRYRCLHPVVQTASLLIDQNERKYNTECDYQRKGDKYGLYGESFCGRNGLFFERKLTFWETIKRIFSV